MAVASVCWIPLVVIFGWKAFEPGFLPELGWRLQQIANATHHQWCGNLDLGS